MALLDRMTKAGATTNSSNWLETQFHAQYSQTELLKMTALVQQSKRTLSECRIPQTQYGIGAQVRHTQKYFKQRGAGHNEARLRAVAQARAWNARRNDGAYNGGRWRSGGDTYTAPGNGYFRAHNNRQWPRAPPTTPTGPSYPSKIARKDWAQDLEKRVKDTHRASMNISALCCRYHMRGQVCTNMPQAEGKACLNPKGKSRLHQCVCGAYHPTYECKEAFNS